VRAQCDGLLRLNQEAMRRKADEASRIARRWFFVTLALAVALMAAGIALASASPWAALACAVYFLAFYPSAIRGEAEFLATRFPDTFAPWAREVPAFAPRLTPGGPRASRFSWARVGLNREWRTLLAVPLALALLWARGRYLPPY